ncbi:hypothetical protein ACLKA6_002969 [Drosophila palustris]
MPDGPSYRQVNFKLLPCGPFRRNRTKLAYMAWLCGVTPVGFWIWNVASSIFFAKDAFGWSGAACCTHASDVLLPFGELILLLLAGIYQSLSPRWQEQATHRAGEASKLTIGDDEFGAAGRAAAMVPAFVVLVPSNLGRGVGATWLCELLLIVAVVCWADW